MQSNNQELIHSVTVGRLDKVSMLLKSGANANSVNSDGYSALHLASLFGNVKIVECLLQAGADVKAVDKLKRSPLHLACESGDENTVLKLIDSGAEVNALCTEGWTPLHIAVIYGNCSAARMLIQHQIDLNMGDDQGNTALHLACFLGNQLMTALLLESGADIALQTKLESLTPIHIASQHGHVGILAIFSEHGVDMNMRNVNLETPLHIACLYNQIESVRFLISLKVNLEQRSKFGTPLQMAFEHNRFEIARLLIEVGVTHDASETDRILNPSKIEENPGEKLPHIRRDNPHRFMKPPKIDWKSEKIPENFEGDYSVLLELWRSIEDRSLKQKCSAMLYAYIHGLGWRHHRELCQTIYNDLNKIEDTPEELYQFFNEKLGEYRFDIRYDQKGGFLHALLFCRDVIVKEQVKPNTSIPLYSNEIFCNLM
jgi:ankyrin repeat protein